jgi:hypothetical protein
MDPANDFSDFVKGLISLSLYIAFELCVCKDFNDIGENSPTSVTPAKAGARLFSGSGGGKPGPGLRRGDFWRGNDGIWETPTDQPQQMDAGVPAPSASQQLACRRF